MAHFGKGGGDRRFDDRKGGNSGFGAREYGRPHQTGGFAKKGWDDRNGGNRERGDITLHSAVCSECGKTCEVPFRPNGSKPVYCKECFGAMKGNGAPEGDRGFDRKSFGGDRDARPSRPQFENTKGGNNDDVKKSIESLSVKIESLTRSIDTLVKSIGSHNHAPAVTPAVVATAPKAAPAPAPAKTADKKVASKVVAKTAEKKPAKKAAPAKKKK